MRIRCRDKLILMIYGRVLDFLNVGKSGSLISELFLEVVFIRNLELKCQVAATEAHWKKNESYKKKFKSRRPKVKKRISRLTKMMMLQLFVRIHSCNSVME